MATNTTNYALVKPAAEDFYDIAVPNGNMDKIDTELKAVSDAQAALVPQTRTVCGKALSANVALNARDVDAIQASAVRLLAPWRELHAYVYRGTYVWTAPDLYGDGEPYEIGVYMIGGGGSGGAAIGGTSIASGGGSGYARNLKKTVTPGNSITLVVGAGGSGVSTELDEYSSVDSTDGNPGGSTSFDGETAAGGGGGYSLGLFGSDTDPAAPASAYVHGADGGQGSDAANRYSSGSAPAMGKSTKSLVYTASNPYITYFGGGFESVSALDLFDEKRYLGAGGAAYAATSGSCRQVAPELENGSSGGDGTYFSGTDGTGDDAGGHGNGGGGCAVYGSAIAYTATSGAGSDGAVLIYARNLEAF